MKSTQIVKGSGRFIMDINMIIKLVKKVPKDKWSDEKTIRKVIKSAGKESGKKFTEEELDQYVNQFKQLKGGSPLRLISMLLKHGISKGQIDDIKNQIKK
jgi:uncharacterized protein YpuA (DUF1002 family)